MTAKAPHLVHGRNAEAAACAHLQAQGLRLCARNYHCAHGEIDLVMRERDTLCFIEVRARTADSHGGAGGSVTYGKQQKIIRAAQHYLLAHPSAADAPCRFDVVTIGPAGLEWLRDAFQAT